MSVFIIIGAASVSEGISETAKTCLGKAKEYATRQKFKRNLRARRNRKREFV